MSFRLLIAAPLGLAMLAGCDTVDPVSGSVDRGFGEAVKYNAALQTIDPAPVYAEGGAQPGDSGAIGAEAVERYRTDRVKAISTQTTTTQTGSGSGTGPQ